jgi:hypothetical protein
MKTARLMMACVLALMMTGAAFAGSLEAPAGPNDPESAMFTLDDIYQRLTTGAAGEKRTGAFMEPGNGPNPGTETANPTLDEVMSAAPAMDNENGATPDDVAAGKTFWGLKDGVWGLQVGTGVNCGK